MHLVKKQGFVSIDIRYVSDIYYHMSDTLSGVSSTGRAITLQVIGSSSSLGLRSNKIKGELNGSQINIEIN